MFPDSQEPGIVIRAPDKTSTRESGDEGIYTSTACQLIWWDVGWECLRRDN